MSLEIRGLTLGMVATNCYIIGDTETGDAVLIDPVDDAPLLQKTIEDAGWSLKLILATHGHYDHVLASKALKDATGAPFYINQHDAQWLDNLPQIGLRYTGQAFPDAAKPDRFLTDEPETIEVGAIKLETLFTPGHAPGHICFYLHDHRVLFCGDCVFQGSIGRTDLPGGDYATLMQSINEKILPLGDDVILLPGHGGQTSIGQEKRSNPFLQE
jgi:hydroxyacylglutathione hydrolase